MVQSEGIFKLSFEEFRQTQLTTFLKKLTVKTRVIIMQNIDDVNQIAFLHCCLQSGGVQVRFDLTFMETEGHTHIDLLFR